MIVVKYWVITANNPEEFSEKVTQFCKEGWELHGGHQIVTGGSRTMWSQSVVMRMHASAIDDMEARMQARDRVEEL